MRSTGRRVSAPWLVLGATFVVALVVSLLLRPEIFTHALFAEGDDAANGLLVLRAKHLPLVEGHYSRTGTNHPGPGWLYLLAAGEGLFYDALHLVPAAFNGQILAQVILQCVCMALAAGAAVALTRSVAGGIWVGAAAFWGFAGWFGHNGVLPTNEPLAATWPPFASFTFMVAVIPLAVAVACGRTRFWPAFVLFGGLMLHTHVAFFLVFGGVFVAVAAAWVVVHRGHRAREVRDHRGTAIWSLVAFVAVIGPIVVRTFQQWPDPWRSWFGFRSTEALHPGAGEVARYFHWVLGALGIPSWTYLAAATVALVLLALDRDPGRRRLVVTTYAVMALVAVLTVVYAFAGIDHMEPVQTFGYIVVYVLAVPILFLAAVALHLGALLRLAVAGRTDRGGVARGAVVAAACLLAAVLVAVAVTPPSSHRGRRGADTLAADEQALAVQLVTYAGIHGTVGIAIENRADRDLWSDLVGVFLAAQRLDPAGSVCADYSRATHDQQQTFSGTFACDGTPAVSIDVTRSSDPSAGQVGWTVRGRFARTTLDYVVLD